MVPLLLVGLLVAWLVLGLFVLDAVVADAGNLAGAVALLVAAVWSGRKRKVDRSFVWIAAYLSITAPFQFLQDLATEQRWPAGQMHELLIARKISGLPALACLAMAGIAIFRKKRRTTTATADGDLTKS